MRKPHTSIFSNVTGHSCGLCGDNESVKYMKQLQNEINMKFKDQCQDLIVYGAALGESYAHWLHDKAIYNGKKEEDTERINSNFKQVVDRHGTCFFQFVSRADIQTKYLKLKSNNTNDVKGGEQWLSADGSQHLIIVDTDKMPYEKERRNVKILKMNPGLLFPWAKRVIWQDTKMLRFKGHSTPSNYLLHFNRTVQRTGTCASFVGLPQHQNTVVRNGPVSLFFHCEAIIKASKTNRRTVSDDINVLNDQCEEYLKKYDPKEEVFTRAQMIDSAFIVYDMRSESCQEFNGKLGCSWLDEIHFKSDRDQVSFPHIVRSLELKLPSNLEDDPGYRNKIYTDVENRTMMHVAKRSCHWYYNNSEACFAEDEDIMNDYNIHLNTSLSNNSRKGNGANPRVAVIIAGTLQRFMYKSILENFAIAMINQKIDADFYISLTTAPTKAYRSNSVYTDHFQQDPYLPRSKLPDSYADT